MPARAQPYGRESFSVCALEGKRRVADAAPRIQWCDGAHQTSAGRGRRGLLGGGHAGRGGRRRDDRMAGRTAKIKDRHPADAPAGPAKAGRLHAIMGVAGGTMPERNGGSDSGS